ncbi:MAG: sodium:solute symporter family protein [Lawsonella sp.]
MTLAVSAVDFRLDASWVDYLIVAIYFAFILGIGMLARRRVSSSIDFFLSGRNLPGWVTGLAFISANLGATEIMGMSATGAQYGFPTFHYYWVGAIPAMLFLGVVMMPFYYGSKVRSVPEFMHERFGVGAHLVNAISFALSQLFIAGTNLYLLQLVVNRLFGWPWWVSLIVGGVIVLTYLSLGGLSAAIYNEVMQFFVIVAGLLPLTLIGLHRVGGWSGLKEKVFADGMLGEAQFHTWPGQALSGFESPILSVIGIVLGLGFVLSFGYWTTNFVEVQRAMASNTMDSARMTPIIGSFPKMFIPFIVVLPGMIAAVLVNEMVEYKQLAWQMASPESATAAFGGLKYNDAILLLMRDILPNGLLGVVLAGLLASFTTGMAANVSSFNAVFTYDIWQRYIVKDKDDKYYLNAGRIVTVAAVIIAMGTSLIAASFSNLMDYLQTLFGFFNAPLFATFIVGMFWRRMTPTAGWVSLLGGTFSAIVVFALGQVGVIDLPGQGLAFMCAITAFVVDVILAVGVSLVTKPKPREELVGFVYSETPKSHFHDPRDEGRAWYRRPVPMATISLIFVIILNIVFA